jgi:hypothetical protein
METANHVSVLVRTNPGVPLVSGTTATVTIRDAEAQESGVWFRQRFANLADHLVDNRTVHSHHQTTCCGIGDWKGTIAFSHPNRPHLSIPQKSTRPRARHE